MLNEINFCILFHSYMVASAKLTILNGVPSLEALDM